MVRKFTIKRNNCIRHFLMKVFSVGGIFSSLALGPGFRRVGGGVGPRDKTAVVPVC